MTELLAQSPLLTVFLVVGLGAVLGAIPFGPIRLGAAGALFIGLVVGAFVPEVGDTLPLVSSLGLALFVYMVGLAAGQTFFADLRKQAPLMGWAVGALLVATAGTVAAGKALGLSVEIVAGVFAGALTATPALAAATDATGSGDPSIGYALGYPIGVVIAILGVSMIVARSWPGRNEGRSSLVKNLFATSVEVTTRIDVRDVHGIADETVMMSYLKRDGRTRVVSMGEELLPDDEILLVGDREEVLVAAEQIGKILPDHLADQRSQVDFQYVTLSNKDLAGHTITELNLGLRFGGVATRVRRGDTEMLAKAGLVLELGDRVLVVVPADQLPKVTAYLGDSHTSVASFSALSVGVGMTIGLLLGMVEMSLPGGSTFSLGPAAGPLIIGMILGYLHRTGPIIWQIPQATNLTIRQLGLLIFLAAVGIGAGPDFMDVVATPTGLKSLALAAITVTLTVGAMILAGRVAGMSAQRTAGAVAGLIGQPAILSYATSRVNDDRIEAGYAALFALGIVVKILLIHAIIAF